MKEWRCNQCGTHARESVVGHLVNGTPEECADCGNEEFTSVATRGPVHSVIDRFAG